MQRAWLFDGVAITVTRIDFVDPALVGEVDVRERGVRIEIRPLESRLHGSGYASPAIALAPAVRRVDLLESRAGAADRMHWHPTMVAGEPGDRTTDALLTADPVGWLRLRLLGLGDPLVGAAAEEIAERWPTVSPPYDVLRGTTWRTTSTASPRSSGELPPRRG